MSIILPPGAQPNDEMVQMAMQQEQQELRNKSVAAQIQNQMLVTVYTKLALEHLMSGEPLTVEVGRELAVAAEDIAKDVIAGYAGFLYEKIGIAQVNKVDKPV